MYFGRTWSLPSHFTLVLLLLPVQQEQLYLFGGTPYPTTHLRANEEIILQQYQQPSEMAKLNFFTCMAPSMCTLQCDIK